MLRRVIMALGLLSQSYVTFIALIYVLYTMFVYGTVMAKVSLLLAGSLVCVGNLKEEDSCSR